MQARQGWFDAVMLGSSTTTYIDQNAFAPLNLFPYSAALMYPGEYKGYIDRLSASNGLPKIIILGVDFFGSRVKKSDDGSSVETAIDYSGDPRYILGYLLSIDLLERSIITAGNSLAVFRPIENLDHYDRRNRRVFAEGMNQQRRAFRFVESLENYRAHRYSNYSYNDHLATLWRELREAYPHARFIVFTTPIAEPLLALLVSEVGVDNFERWLTDLTLSFGEVWNFSTVNSVTTTPEYYRDVVHFHQRIGSLIADRLMDRALPRQFADFGQLVTPTNLATYLAKIRNQLAHVDADPIATACARLEAAGGAAAECRDPAALQAPAPPGQDAAGLAR
jgi:hypothetical protein